MGNGEKAEKDERLACTEKVSEFYFTHFTQIAIWWRSFWIPGEVTMKSLHQGLHPDFTEVWMPRQQSFSPGEEGYRRP